MFGFFTSRRPASTFPSIEKEADRYEGRPLVLILERYVLSCIGENDREVNMAAIVQKVWGGDQDWRQTVRQQLELPESVDEAIRGIWEKNLLIARQNKTSLHPIQFAKMFVDSNFAMHIEKIHGV